MNLKINQAVSLLKEGKLVAFPTETVYGLGADARNSMALQRLFQAKKRPTNHPVIVHVASIQQLSDWAIDIPDAALVLARHFWPGPMTLILKKAPHVLEFVTGGQDTIGLRIPQNPVALELLEKFGGGLAAPSANRFGHISPTTAQAVYEELGDLVDGILDGGKCDVGVESTIVDLTQENPRILRPGMISPNDITTVLNQPVNLFVHADMKVSGNLKSHYAPETKTVLIEPGDFSLIKSLQNTSIALVSRVERNISDVINVVMPSSPKEYARDLYFVLRDLDKKKLSCILIENVPDHVEWDAVRDRLQKASAR